MNTHIQGIFKLINLWTRLSKSY